MIRNMVGQSTIFRTALLLFAILSCIQCSNPKTYKELAHEFDSLYQSQHYEQAYQVGQTMLSREEYRYEVMGESGLLLHSLMGLIAVKYQRYEEAERYFQRNVVLLEREQQQESKVYIDNVAELATVYFSTKRYAQAIKVLKISIDVRQRKYPEEHSFLAMDYLNVGFIQLNYGNVASAYVSLRKAWELYAALQDRPKLLSAMGFYTEACLRVGKYAEAIEVAKKALSIVHNDELSERAVLHTLLGMTYLAVEQYALSEQELTQAYKLSKASNVPFALYSWVLPALAEMYSTCGKEELATEYFETVLKRRQEQEQDDIDEISLGRIFVSYGNHFLRYHDYEKAIEFFNRAWAICKTSIGTNSSTCLLILQRLDSTYTLLGQVAKSNSIKAELEKIQKQPPL